MYMGAISLPVRAKLVLRQLNMRYPQTRGAKCQSSSQAILMPGRQSTSLKGRSFVETVSSVGLVVLKEGTQGTFSSDGRKSVVDVNVGNGRVRVGMVG